jgi:hypothetical protein
MSHFVCGLEDTKSTVYDEANISKRTSSGRSSTVNTRPTSHQISQQSLGGNARAQQETYVDCRDQNPDLLGSTSQGGGSWHGARRKNVKEGYGRAIDAKVSNPRSRR